MRLFPQVVVPVGVMVSTDCILPLLAVRDKAH